MFGRLKKKVRADIYVSSDAEIKQLLSSVAGTDMELPVLLAAFGPMRRGEICALSSEDISGNVVHVCKNMVINGDREWIIKTPTFSVSRDHMANNYFSQLYNTKCNTNEKSPSI